MNKLQQLQVISHTFKRLGITPLLLASLSTSYTTMVRPSMLVNGGSGVSALKQACWIGTI